MLIDHIKMLKVLGNKAKTKPKKKKIKFKLLKEQDYILKMTLFIQKLEDWDLNAFNQKIRTL